MGDRLQPASPSAVLRAGLLGVGLLLSFCKLAAARPQQEAVTLQDPAEIHPLPPVFAHSFEVEYNFSLPYVKHLQKDGLTYPVHVWKDAKLNALRVDTWGHTNSLITKAGRSIEIAPVVDKLECMKFDDDENLALGFSVNDALLGSPVMPDVHKWTYGGCEEIGNQKVFVWVLDQKHGAKETVYKFYVSASGDPVRLEMHGNDMFSGAHFDKWVVDYKSYKAGPVDKDIFEPPKLCEGVAAHATKRRSMGFALRMGMVLPSVATGDDGEYNEFALQHGRKHGSLWEYEMRRRTFHANKIFIDQHNARNEASYTMAVNRFADWSHEEFLAVMLPTHGQPKPQRSNKLAALHKAVLPAGRIPTSLTWRGSGADGPVKDQANCGSCWAFGASGVLQAGWFMATGEEVLVSEQQLMDCSWRYNNSACDGGLYEGAFDYIVDNGGISSEAGYEYRGQDAFCQGEGAHVANSIAKFKGYVAVHPYNDLDLMEACYSKGPIAISIDAAQPGFRFYASGVYDEASCEWEPDKLDHAVMLMGYGTTASGKDYWLVKNSWSTYWGDKGYIKISRDHHGCGVTTDPAYVIADTSGREQQDVADA